MMLTRDLERRVVGLVMDLGKKIEVPLSGLRESDDCLPRVQWTCDGNSNPRYTCWHDQEPHAILMLEDDLLHLAGHDCVGWYGPAVDEAFGHHILIQGARWGTIRNLGKLHTQHL